MSEATVGARRAGRACVAERLRAALGAWWPQRMRVGAGERWRAACGAGLGLLCVALLSRVFAGTGTELPWLVAPLGASAVLVFCVPASPLAQPWAVLGGNTLSALVGIACARWIGDPAWAGAAAVALAIGAMFMLRCLHPPGGAMALYTALAGVGSFGFAWFPAGLNSLLLVVAGAAYNRVTGRRYPHPQGASVASRPGAMPRFAEADLDAVLERYNQVLDVPRDDLAELLLAAEGQAYRRRMGAVRCADIMSRDLVTVTYGTTLEEAWTLMRRHRIKSLPVIDGTRRLMGILTLADFLRSADLELHDGWPDRLRDFIRRSTTLHTDRPEYVGQIMTRQVRVTSAERPVAELVPLFAEAGHHHIPVVGEGAQLVGVVTQSDVVKALLRAV